MYIPCYLWINRRNFVQRVNVTLLPTKKHFKSDSSSCIIAFFYWFCCWGINISSSFISQVNRIILTAFGVKAETVAAALTIKKSQMLLFFFPREKQLCCQGRGVIMRHCTGFNCPRSYSGMVDESVRLSLGHCGLCNCVS